MEKENTQTIVIEENFNSGSGLSEELSTCSSSSIGIVTPHVDFVETNESIPLCPKEVLPSIGMVFKSLHEGYVFYRKYAISIGFNTRKSTTRNKNDVLWIQHFICARAGYKESQRKETIIIEESETGQRKRKRNTLETRVGCKAKIIFRYSGEGTYTVINFTPEHNHDLYTPGSVKFQKEGRKLNILHKKMIVDNSKMNIGAVQSFRIMKEFTGGYDNIGASKQDFKNFQRDLKAYIKESDAQMFVNHYESKKLLWTAFFFEYEVDEEEQLCRAFWADPMCRKNYALYGDMVSFDTTFKTNRYSMIFGPFTGVDNHNRCISFGACLIAQENAESFEWVFRTFLKAVGNNEPVCLISDQDAGIRKAFELVFKKAQHRYCMWHIMKKMNEKVGKGFELYAEFRQKLDAFVWSLEIEPAEFVAGWRTVISEYELEEHTWLNDLFDIKELWIPAYFRHLYLGSLMRTTSRSESENSFFNRFTTAFLTLVEFNMRYDTAIDAQRHEQAKYDNDGKNKKVSCNTPMQIEKNAAELYTPSMFYMVQNQIEISCYYCGFKEFKKQNGLDIFNVSQRSKDRTFEVAYNSENDETTCSCKLFERQGIPCAHMFHVWKTRMIEVIPKKYVLNRWTIFAAKKTIFDIEGNILEECARTSDNRNMLNDLWSEMMMCVSLAETDQADLQDVLRNMKELRKGLEDKRNGKNDIDRKTSKQKEIEILIGAAQPTEILVKEPKISKNKGTGVQLSGSQKRLKSIRDKIIEKNQKPMRMCNMCHKMAHHDLRTCDLNPKNQAKKKT